MIDNPFILVIDDEPAILETLKDSLEDENFRVETLSDGTKALDVIGKIVPDIVLLDIFMPNCNGIELLTKIKTEYPQQKVIMISGFGSISIALDAVKKGALDFIEKPLNFDDVLAKLLFLKSENGHTQENILEEDYERYGIIGKSYLFKELMYQVSHLVKLKYPLLIYGPAGTGKSLLARYIHSKNHNTHNNFTTINCSVIEKNEHIDREIFRSPGTVYLKNIDQLSLALQKTVLGYLELSLEQNSTKTPRIIASSTRPLFDCLQDGSFNPMLFNKLNITPLEISSLNKRRYDIPLLVDYYLKKANSLYEKNVAFSNTSLRLLRNHTWKRNITELQELLELLVAQTTPDQTIIDHQTLLDSLDEKEITFIEEQSFLRFKSLEEASETFERNFLLYLLKKNRYDIHQISDRLNMKLPQLRNKMLALNIECKN